MKRFIYFFILASSFLFLFWQKELLFSRVQLIFQSPCDRSITYRIDEVDQRFGISRADFIQDTNQATLIWEEAINKDLFIYDPLGELSINLVYDERQSVLTQMSQLKDEVDNGKTSLEAQKLEFERLLENFNQRLENFNQEVSFWNNQDGAPPKVFDKLIKEQQELQIEADDLNQLAQELDLSTTEYNLKVGQLNESVETWNEDLEQKPEEGIYIPAEHKIKIYLNVNQNELVHTLAHELGHALSLDHLNDPQAMMYIYTNDQLSLVVEDVQQLQDVCEHGSPWEILKSRAINFLQRLLKTL